MKQGLHAMICHLIDTPPNPAFHLVLDSVLDPTLNPNLEKKILKEEIQYNQQNSF